MYDKGAHYYRCDFQVHSPRDISWNGERHVTEAERRAYADSFVQQCIEKNLHSVAITDHHDVVFYHYIKEAAESLRTSTGTSLYVFPGIEVSIAIPSAQLLILFDPDIPGGKYRNIPLMLGVTPSSDTEATTCETEQLNISVQDITTRLNEFGLTDKYIILPNVKPGGYKTFLRKGNHTLFSQLPCVGGYIEGTNYSSLKPGDRNILEGKIADWSTQAYGVFQTSDARHADFSQLGVFSTWVKWTRPSTEAIRQACLSQDCRISHDTPRIPNSHIDRVEVSTSRFLGAVDLNLNPQFNAFIGGRGTGKSSLLEYIRWGLCDPSIDSEDNTSSVEKKRSDLLKSTLESEGGIVTVEWTINGVRHKVRRSTVERTIELTIGDLSPRAVSPEEVRSLLFVQAYSQKQLSTVGVNLSELRRFTELPVQNVLRDLQNTYDNLCAAIRQNLVRIQEYDRYRQTIGEDRSKLASLRAQSRSLRGQMVDLSPDDKDALETHQQFMQDRAFIVKIGEYITRVSQQEQLLLDAVLEINSFDEVIYESKNQERIQLTIQQLHKSVDKYTEKVKELSNLLVGNESSKFDWENTLSQIEDVCSEHDSKYQQALLRNAAYNETLILLSSIEDGIVLAEKSVEEKEKQLQQLGSPLEDLKDNLESLRSLYLEERKLYEFQCHKLTSLSEGIIEATLSPVGDIPELVQFIRETFQGSRIDSERIVSLCDRLTDSKDPFTTWQSILAEFRMISEWTIEKVEESGIPKLDILGSIFLESEIRRMIQRLDFDRYASLLLYRLKQKPVFKYCVPGGGAIDFSQASAGQQASALLHVLLSIDGPPLIIDQPEDDLDNAVISQIAQQIWNAKKKRQLIFSSHNANLVVNGDAELVVHFDYINSADHSGGGIVGEGSIDVPEIKNAVTKVMEGGDYAFKLRQQKYGF